MAPQRNILTGPEELAGGLAHPQEMQLIFQGPGEGGQVGPRGEGGQKPVPHLPGLA